MNMEKRKHTRHGGGFIRVTGLLMCLALVLVSIGSCAFTVFAQPEEDTAENIFTAYEPFGEGIGYSAVLYNNTNGLPTPEANAIVQTPDGFIWIGSYGGLVRYDGNDFQRIDSSSGITGVKSLFVDHKGRLWIGSTDDSISLMETDSFRHWGRKEGFLSSSVKAITEDDNGLMYFAARNGVYTIDADMKLTLIEDKKIQDPFISDMKKGPDGLMYCLTKLGDIFTLKDGKVVKYLGGTDSTLGTVNSILPDPDNPGYVYLGGEGSFLYYGTLDIMKADFSVFTINPVSYAQRMEILDGKIWICGGNGIGVLEDGILHPLENIPFNNSVEHAMMDHEGNYWFVSTRQGVMKVVPNQFTDLYERIGLPDVVVNATCIYDNKLFVGTDEGLTVIDENGLVKSLPVSYDSLLYYDPFETDLIDELGNSRIRSMTCDSKGRLWIATWSNTGLICYEKGKAYAYDELKGFDTPRVRVVKELSDGTIAAAYPGGLLMIKDDKIVRTYGQEDGLTDPDILTLEEGENGDIILGSNGEGLYIVNGDNVRHIGEEDGLNSNVIMRIKRDRKSDIFWMVTNNSIKYMTPDYKITTVKNFPYSNNFDLYQNSNDEMWVLSSNGIYVVSTKEMLENKEIDSVHYDLSNGLPVIATANSYSALSEDGNLFISGGTGVTRVNIDTHFVSSADIKAEVPYIEADGKRIYPDKNGDFTIPSTTRKLTIYSYVFNYSLVTPQVSYRLDGFDKEFTTVSRNDLDPVDYTNLRGGVYKYVMKITAPFGSSENNITVRIIKTKAFYELLWFNILVGVVAILIILLIVRSVIKAREKKLEMKHREEVEKEKLNTELKTASEIQLSIMPSDFPAFPDRKDFDIYAKMDPARAVGGDFYDFFLIDEDHLCMVMADVSGKGVPAALFMMTARVIINNYAMMGNSPAEILFHANEQLSSNNKKDMFVTVWVGILELSTGKLTASSAGHEFPALLQPGGKFELYKDRHGLVVGAMEYAKYRNYEIELKPGAKLFIYTDGVPEATDADDQLFGADRMIEALNIDVNADPEHLLINVRKEIDAFVKKAEQFDDLTMLCLEYKGRSEKPSEEKSE